MSMMTNIVDTLKSAGIAAYLPGKHDGPCRSAYVTVEDGGVIQTGKTTGRHVYMLTAMAPMESPSSMTTLLTNVRTAMTGLHSLRPTGNQSPDDVDEESEAYVVTLEYAALCSI